MIKENLYKILGLLNFASPEAVKTAYRALALRYHPDRGGDVEMMKKINVAYQILSEKKEEYDNRLRGHNRPAIIIQAHGWARAGTDNTTSGTWSWIFKTN